MLTLPAKLETFLLLASLIESFSLISHGRIIEVYPEDTRGTRKKTAEVTLKRLSLFSVTNGWACTVFIYAHQTQNTSDFVNKIFDLEGKQTDKPTIKKCKSTISLTKDTVHEKEVSHLFKV